MEERKKTINRKKIILTALIGILLVVGVSYAWLRLTSTGEKSLNVQLGPAGIDLVETSGNLALSGAVPLPDRTGKKGEAFTFYIQNNSAIDFNFDLKLIDNDEKKAECQGCKFIPAKDIRYELIRTGLDKVDTLSEDRVIDTGVLKRGEKNRITYTLKIWLSKDAVEADAYDAVFYGKIAINATQIPGSEDKMDDSGANAPRLGNLVPVVYNTDHWEKADVTTAKEWYDYEDQRWANAVVVSPEKYNGTYKSAAAGTEVKMDDILQMYVWIPRYSYAIQGTYGKKESGRTDDPTQLLPGEIDVKFIGATEKNTGDGKYDSGTPTDNDWYTPDAFTLGTQQLSGLWVGKFETGYSGAGSTLAAQQDTSNESSKVIIKPNVYSWRYITVSNIYKTVKGITNEQTTFGLSSETYDSHAMKNSEWGAVAYLTQSKYGKYGNSQYTGANKEVYRNNYNGYKTGCSGMAPGASTSSTCTPYDDLTDQGGGKGLKGPGASTTGNVYGIYDMSGGAYECVMGNYNKTTGSSGFTNSDNWTTTDEKYFNFYTSTSSTDTKYKSHAIGETDNWYGDLHDMVSSSDPWFRRGGYYGVATSAGVFSYISSNGSMGSLGSFRVVLTLKETA